MKAGDTVLQLPMAILVIEDDDDRTFAAQLYFQYSKLMFGTALFYLQNYHDAQDAVNDAIIRLIDRIPELRGKSSCVLRSYVVTTIVRTSLNALKRRNKQNHTIVGIDEKIADTVADDSPLVDNLVISRITNEELLHPKPISL